MPARPLFALLAGLALLVPFAASGDESPVTTTATAPAAVMDPLSEAIRERVDHLRYELEHDHRDHAVRGERIVLGDTVARYYESQQFQPAVARSGATEPAGGLRSSSSPTTGSTPTTTTSRRSTAYRAELRTAKVLPDGEQAALELARHRRDDARALPPLPRQGGPGEAELAVELLRRGPSTSSAASRRSRRRSPPGRSARPSSARVRSTSGTSAGASG